jgi:hypothetical protein
MRRVWLIVFWTTTLASIVPLLTTRFLPFTDLPEHVAAIGTVARMITGDRVADPYVVDLARSQYFLYHAIGGALAVVTRDAIRANQLLLAVVAVLWPVSLRSLLRATGRDERFAIFGTMLFYSRPLAIGFLPYLASVPIAVFALAVLARHCRRPTWGRGIALMVLAVLLFYMHVSSYVIFGMIAGAWTIVAKRNVREVALRALWFLPSAALALVWWHAGSLVRGTVPTERDIGRMNIVRSLNAFPVWTFDVWKGHVDEACAALWWTAFGLAMYFGLRRAGRPRVLALVPVAAAAAVYLVTPFRVGNATMLNVRLAPLVTLFALLPLSAVRGSHHAWTKWPLSLAAVASLLTSMNTTYEARRVSNEMVGDFGTLLAKMEPGKNVVMMNYDRDSPRTHFWPYVFAGSYHRALHGGVAGWSFTELPHWPLHYAPGAAPPHHHPFWVFDPNQYRGETDGRYYDYALVQGDRDPFEDASGPRFERLASSGRFTLYAKATTPD